MHGRKEETATSHQLFQLSLSPLTNFPILLHLDCQISEHRLSFSAHTKELWKLLFVLCFFFILFFGSFIYI